MTSTITLPSPVANTGLTGEIVLQWAIPLDLNSDGRDDFLVHYWRQVPQSQFGMALSDYTADAIFALMSQPDGSYKTDNLSIFGTPNPKLGGVGFKYVSGDINGDGVLDYALAMNSEDGRTTKDVNTNEARPAIILSKPGGKFEIIRLGQDSWGAMTSPHRVVRVVC